MKDKLHINIVVTGKVQGVFFRASAMEQALDLGITGFVRNQNDGSVYLEAEGDPDKLDELVAWCKKGSQFSRVDQVEVNHSAVEEFSEFTIKR